MNEEYVKETLVRHEKILNDHDNDIDKLKQDNASLKTEIKNLCNNLEKLTGTLNKLTYAIVTALGGFFIWAIQSNLFK